VYSIRFTTEDEKNIEALVGMGFPRAFATVLVFFSKKKSTCYKEIVRCTQLSHTDVHHAFQVLQRRGWVECRIVRRDCRGRPPHRYRLKVPYDQIIREIIEDEKKKIRRIEENVNRLKALMEP